MTKSGEPDYKRIKQELWWCIITNIIILHPEYITTDTIVFLREPLTRAKIMKKYTEDTLSCVRVKWFKCQNVGKK